MIVPTSSIESERGLFVEQYNKPASEQTGLLLVNARNIAIMSNSNLIGSDHLLFGLVQLESARPLLEKLLYEPERRLGKLGLIMRLTMQRGNLGFMTANIEYKQRSIKILRLATSHSDRMGDEEVEPYHVMLGVGEEKESTAGGLLLYMGVNYESIQRAVDSLKEPSVT